MPHACPIRRKEYEKKYYQDNKERIAKRDKEYRENNKGRHCGEGSKAGCCYNECVTI